MPASSDVLVWLDMEMTGLDPVTCVPLQVAAIITDAELRQLDQFERTIFQDEAALSVMDGFVRNMHTKNGLLEQVRSSVCTLEAADRELGEFISTWCKSGTGLLAGNSIHQDRRFLEAYFPATSPWLHYRMVDVSTLKELSARWYPKDAAFNKTGADHTALADIRESIRELAHYRSMFFRPAT